MSVTLERQIDASLNSFEKAIVKHPEVVDCWLMTGDNDYLLRILAPSLREYENFLTGTLQKYLALPLSSHQYHSGGLSPP